MLSSPAADVSIDTVLDTLRRQRVPEVLIATDDNDHDDAKITFTTTSFCCIKSKGTISRLQLQTHVKNQVQQLAPGSKMSSNTYAPYYYKVLTTYRKMFQHSHKIHLITIVLVILLSIIIKLLIGSTFGHSGFQTLPIYGAVWNPTPTPPQSRMQAILHGDFEAQRHWMEITTNLPLRDWYIQTPNNDLQYWGLDYPPVSAFWAFVTGLIAQLYDPTITELLSSRGNEESTTRWFMRLSVVVSDLLFFIPSVLLLVNTICDLYNVNVGSDVDDESKCDNNKNPTSPTQNFTQNTATLAAALIFQPLLLLIDHGHFQYNSIAVGLLFLSIKLTLDHNFFLVAIIFPLCCFFKQTGLYFALPLFTYIVSVLLQPHPQKEQLAPQQQPQSPPPSPQPQSKPHPLRRFRLTFKSILIFITLGAIATLTFAMCFLPFIISALSDPELTTPTLVQVVHSPLGSTTYLTSQLLTDAQVGSALNPLVGGAMDQTWLLLIHFISTTKVSWRGLFTASTAPTPTLIIGQVITTVKLGFELSQMFATQLLIPQIKPTILPIIGRMFPFKRGMFEDKVASLWCIGNVIIKWHQTFDISTLTRLSTFTTLLLLLPSLLALFLAPMWDLNNGKALLSKRQQLLNSLVVSALAFFLASMQTHEKTIMYSLLPLCLLSIPYPTLYHVVVIIANTTCMFLLKRDGQFIPYCVIQTIFCLHSLQTSLSNPRTPLLSKFAIICAVMFPIAVWAIKAFVSPPPHLPDLIELVTMGFGFGTFIIAWFWLTINQWVELPK